MKVFIMSKIISNIIYIAIAIIFGITMIPFAMGYRPVVVLSGSMEPTYPIGAIIYYKATDFADIEAGDVITFELGGGALATHRVMQKDNEKQEFVTKGDNNQTEDTQPISATSVVGRVGKVVIPYLGFAGIYIKKTPIMIMIGSVLIICAILGPQEEKMRKNKCKE